MTSFWDQVLAFATDISCILGAELLDKVAHSRYRQAAEKEDGSLVTECDTWADATIRKAIAQSFPDHGVLSEEGSHQFPQTDWCWIVDPIDGTTNFSRGIPVWGISLGLLYRGHPVFGCVYLPPINQLFHGFWAGDSAIAQSGLPPVPVGAYCNNKPITVSVAGRNSNSLFSLCSRSMKYAPHPFSCKIRAVGVATYNLLTVASGITVGALEATPKVWDISAVWVILHAAGAVWIDLSGTPAFPLVPGQSYGLKQHPTLAVNHHNLVKPFRQELRI
ncbi:MAG: inositol monophosphatase family protein [Cyanobacteria bacterium P01_D01_bin.73]